MADVSDQPHEATDVEGHPTRRHGTGGHWRNELEDAIVGEGHPHIDRRSLEMARLIVEKIDADPGLFQVAHENLQRWKHIRGGNAAAVQGGMEGAAATTLGPGPQNPPRRIGRGATAAELASIGEYYDAIRESSAEGESTPFIDYMLSAILAAILTPKKASK